jgi:hypothetical protein
VRVVIHTIQIKLTPISVIITPETPFLFQS